MSDFANATLQTLGRDQLEVSIACHLDDDLRARLADDADGTQLAALLQQAADAVDGLHFEVQMGPFGTGP